MARAWAVRPSEFKRATYIQSEARQDIAFHLPGGQMSEVLPSQKSDLLLVLIRAALVAMLVQPETVPTEVSDEFVCPTGSWPPSRGVETRRTRPSWSRLE